MFKTILFVLLPFVSIFPSENLSLSRKARSFIEGVEILGTHVTAQIENHYVKTTITTEYYNPGTDAEEIDFDVALPNTAFVTGLTIQVDGKYYKSTVEDKDTAEQKYDKAVDEGIAAAQVLSARIRNANGVTVPINVEPGKKMKVILTYEELLTKLFNSYSWIFNLFMTQRVGVFSINVYINESVKLKKIHVPVLKPGDLNKDIQIKEDLLTVKNINDYKGYVLFETKNLEAAMGLRTGIKDVQAKFVVNYEVDDTQPGGHVLIRNDGYFVHFMPSPIEPVLPKHVVFVLDTSYSMYAKKLDQLKTAMVYILNQLNDGDYFHLVEYNSKVKVWNLDKGWAWQTTVPARGESGLKNHFLRNLPNPYPASEQYKKKAKDIIRNMKRTGATNIYDSLKTGLVLANKFRLLGTHPEPIMIFLTDGWATVGIKDVHTILKMTQSENYSQKKINIYSIAFGKDANKNFLTQLSIQNSGFMRYVYEASDASFQITDLYQAVSSPVLSNVQFIYPQEAKQLTDTNLNTLYQGQEHITAGKLPSNKYNQNDFSITGTCSSGLKKYTPIFNDIFGYAAEEVRQEEQYKGLERMWAYITVTQMIKNGQKKEAIDLALKYSFVTEFTSLVVVKPDEDAAETKYAASLKTLNLREVYGKQLASRFMKKSPIDTLPWLGDFMVEEKLKISDEIYEIGNNSTQLSNTNEDELVCDVPKTGLTGKCTLLSQCPAVHSTIIDMETYVEYFCALEEEKFAGVCCVNHTSGGLRNE